MTVFPQNKIPALQITVYLTLLLSISSYSWAQKAANKTTPVVAQAVIFAPYSQRIDALGTLKSNEAVTLSASVTKIIQAIHFDDGQRVKQGDILVEMASREEKALLNEAELLLSESTRQYNRIKSLQKRNLAADSELDEKRLNRDTAQAKLEAVRARLADRTIIAPFDGVMGLRQISLGALVKPGDTIATLDNDSVMKLDISLPALYLNTVKVGMDVEAIAADLDRESFYGKVVSIDSRINPNTRSITVRALLDNPEQRLISGMLMQTTLQQSAIERAMIPEEALVQEGVNRYVFVVNKQQMPFTAEKRPVISGDRFDGKVIILKGLNKGESVVTRGTMRLNAGSKIELQSKTINTAASSEVSQ